VSVRSEVLLWAQRIVAKKNAHAHQLLEIAADAGIEDAQAAFHKIARMAHPDLHRASLPPEDLELVTLAYSRIAGAYQDLRIQRMQTTRIRPIRDTSDPTPSGPDAAVPVPDVPRPQSAVAGAAGAMGSKALVYYRKAELALRRGDLQGATLQLKMAIAADPSSTLLRNALAEVMAEVGKTP
jgi:hypothetical protein